MNTLTQAEVEALERMDAEFPLHYTPANPREYMTVNSNDYKIIRDWIELRRLASALPAVPHGVVPEGFVLVPVERLELLRATLDGMVGDTDPNYVDGETDDDIRSESPAFWSAREVNALLAAPSVPSAGVDWKAQYLERRAVIQRWHEKAVALGYDGVNEMLAFALPCIVNSGGDERAPAPQPAASGGVVDEAMVVAAEQFLLGFIDPARTTYRQLHAAVRQALTAALATPQAREGDARDGEFELCVDDEMVAGASGPRESALREIRHYASQYAADGKLTVYEVTRTDITDAALADKEKGK